MMIQSIINRFTSQLKTPSMSVINLGVADVAVSTKFYRDFGFEQFFFPTDSVFFFKTNRSWIAIYSLEKLAAEIGEPFEKGTGLKPFTLTYHLESPAQVDKMIDHLLKIGAKLIKKPQKSTWVGYAGYITDPDNVLWEIGFNPFFRLPHLDWRLDNSVWSGD